MSDRACDEIRALLPAQLDGDLEPGAAARVREHLEVCAACREHREDLCLAVDALRRLPDLPPPASILAGVRARLRPVPWHQRLLGRRPWLVGVPAGALATALVAVGVALFQARYPRLPQAVGERAVPPPEIARDVRQPVPEPQPRPQAPVGAVRSGVPEPTPAPAAKRAPAPPAQTAVKAAPPPAVRTRAAGPPHPQAPQSAGEPPPGGKVPLSPAGARDIAGARPEPFAAATAPAPVPVPARASAPEPAPQPAPAPLPAPRTTAAPRTVETRQEVLPLRTAPPQEAPPPARFAAPLSGVSPRSLVGTPVPAGEGAASPFRASGPPAAGGRSVSRADRAPSAGDGAAASGTVTLRGAQAPAAGAGLRMAGAPKPPPGPASEQQAQPPEMLEGLTVLLAAGEDLEEIKALVRRDGGRTVETRVLEPRERREAFAPHRARAGLRGEVSRGWRLTVRMPPRAVAGFAESVERRPGRLVLERRTVPLPPRGRPAELQTLHITVLR